MNSKKNTRVVSNKRSNKASNKLAAFSIKTAELQIGVLEQSEVDFDNRKLARAKLQWYLGDWEALASMEIEDSNSHQYGLLCLMKATGLQQTGDLGGTLEFATLAKNNNVDNQLLKQMMVGGLYHSLGRIHVIKGEYEKAQVKISKGITLVKQVEDTESGMLSRYTREVSTYGNSDLAVGMIKSKLPKRINALRPSELSRRLNELTLAISSLKSKSSGSATITVNRQMTTPGDVLMKRAESATILIAGMRHSGSTLLFNIVRIASELSGLSVKGCYSEKMQSTQELVDACQILLIKTHEYRDDIADMGTFTLTTIRDLRETVASASRRKFPTLERVGGAVEYAKYNRSIHDVWSSKSNFLFEYETFMKKPFQVLQRILLALDLDVAMADDIYRTVISLPTDNYNDTLFSDIHITDPKRESNYVTSLGPEDVKKIEEQHQGWFDLHGYGKGS
jgi:hypothetical protein